MNQILSKIGLYSDRQKDNLKQLQKAREKENNKLIKKYSDAYSNNCEKFDYWNGKKNELISKTRRGAN